MDILAPSAGAVILAAVAVDMLHPMGNHALAQASPAGTDASTRFLSRAWLEYAAMTHALTTTPAADGFRMPAEFERHAGCLDAVARAARQLAPWGAARATSLRPGRRCNRAFRAGHDRRVAGVL